MTSVKTSKPGEETLSKRALIKILLATVATAAAIVWGTSLLDLLGSQRTQTWLTIFVAISVQAMPFLVFGTMLSGAIAAFVPASFLAKALPSNPKLAVPVAGVAGAALPGCECGSVPIAGRLVARGVAPAAAMTFLLAAPAINPVVIVATYVAFPGSPEMALARFVASLFTSIVVGLVWIRLGREEWIEKALRNSSTSGPKWSVFVSTASHDFLHAGAYLVIGAATAASLQTIIPRSILDGLAGNGLTAILTMAILAVVLALCSEADAFVAAGLSQFSLTSRLVFLVVGPMVDVKLLALQSGVFGRRFASRSGPLTFGAAVVVACLTGWVLL